MSRPEGRYRCVHCGDRFNVSPEDQEAIEEGYISILPDTCDECCGMLNHPPHDIYELYPEDNCGL